jgi:hypothetical protein
MRGGLKTKIADFATEQVSKSDNPIRDHMFSSAEFPLVRSGFGRNPTLAFSKH